MFLKTALICEGLTACNPKHALAFGITNDDCAWGHDLLQLARLLTKYRPDFGLTANLDVRGYWPHKMPMTIRDGSRCFNRSSMNSVTRTKRN